MKVILDGIKTRNDERRKKKEEKARKYAEEIRKSKNTKPASNYPGTNNNMNFAYNKGVSQ